MNKLSEEILNYLLDSSDSMISIINDKMRYVAVNEPFCKGFSMSKKELVGKCPSELWGENIYRGKIRANLERSLGGETVKYRAFFDIPDSPGKYYDVSYRPFKSPGTNLNYTIIETKGIGAGDKLNGQFIDSDQKYKYSESYLPFGMFSCDSHGTILRANDTFYDILEVGRSGREKLNFNDLLKSDLRFPEHLRSGKKGETATFSKVQMHTPGGKEIFARISSHVREDEHFDIITNGTLEDVTREVVLERQLQQAQRLETLGTLAGGVAHDFNTILTTISGYSEMTMEEAGNNSVVCEYMANLKAAINKAQNIINQMLVFSRQLEQHRVALEADKILKEAVDFIKTSLPSSITLKADYKSFNGYVYADPTQLFRVFLNIMTNALHAMGDKEGTLTISLAESEIKGSRYADIGITDTGKGIDPSIIDRIFEPFFTTRKDDRGTGMGLAVAHGIITGIGGEINVESTPGKGSLFTLRIPLEKAGPGTTHTRAKYPGNILFAHDNLHLSRTVSAALERMGYNVILIPLKSEAENMIRHHLSDNDKLFIVGKFTDSEIYSLLEDKQKKGMNLKVCIITGKDAPGDKITSAYHGAKFAYIYEPLTLKDILTCLY